MPRTKGNIRKRDNGKFQVNWMEADGRRLFRTFDTAADAKAHVHAVQAEQDDVRAGNRRYVPSDKTFDDLVGLWVDEKSDKRSLRDDQSRIKTHLKPVLTGVRLLDIDKACVLRAQKRAQGRGVKTGTVRQILALLRAMLRLAVSYEWLHSAPQVRLPAEAQHAYQWLRSEDEIRSFLASAARHPYRGLVPIYATAVYTGMRAGELFGLRWCDVDFARRLITVQRSYAQETTKTNRIRRVPILDPLVPLLRAWRDDNPRALLVFPNEVGKMQSLHPRVTKGIFASVLTAADIPRLKDRTEPKLKFHDLRHTFASHWVHRGKDLYKLQRILGHTSVKLTQRYAHLAPDAFENDLDAFGDYLPQEAAGP